MHSALTQMGQRVGRGSQPGPHGAGRVRVDAGCIARSGPAPGPRLAREQGSRRPLGDPGSRPARQLKARGCAEPEHAQSQHVAAAPPRGGQPVAARMRAGRRGREQQHQLARSPGANRLMRTRHRGVVASRPARALSSAESRRTKLNCWNTKPMSRRAWVRRAPLRRCMGCPATQASPASMSTSRVKQRNRVVLPAPLGPKRATISPGSTCSDTPSSTRARPWAFERPTTWMPSAAVIRTAVREAKRSPDRWPSPWRE